MKEMLDLTPEDIYSTFIVVDKFTKNRLLSRYCGRDGFGENSHLTHRFELSYTSTLNIYAIIYPISCQSRFILQSIDLPFDILSIINQYLHE